MVGYIFRCWPLMPTNWKSKDIGIEYECFDLPDEDVDELCGYMDLDAKYSMTDDDEEGRIIALAKRDICICSNPTPNKLSQTSENAFIKFFVAHRKTKQIQLVIS